ncbi:MAG: DUF523 domain-containing protein [Proteobacteria bacterium]|nr:DUF523 domain-containing protein [Pseudomonadota bacterium]
MERRPRVGISACLLGERVRYDGGHKRQPLLLKELGPLVEWVSVCPEVEAGMGTPRPPLCVRRDGPDGGLRLLERVSGRDHTARMRRWAASRIEQLRRLELCGYVLKARSPSCGIRGVEGGGRGLFADLLMRAFPDLPVEDEARLEDAAVRRAFAERVVALHQSLL